MHVCVHTVYIPYKNYIIFNYLFNLLTKEKKIHFQKRRNLYTYIMSIKIQCMFVYTQYRYHIKIILFIIICLTY